MQQNTFLIINKIKKYLYHQRLVNFFACLIFTLATLLIAFSITLFLLKSPFYTIVGILPIFFYRPLGLLQAARAIERKIGLKDELVNSIQLSSIPEDSKEGYSQELIHAYIDNVAKKIKDIDFNQYLSRAPLFKSCQILLIAIALALFEPAFLPTRFWFAINKKIDYAVKPGNGHFLKGSELALSLRLNGVYVPKAANILITKDGKTIKKNITVKNGTAQYKIELIEPVSYYYEFLNCRTEKFKLETIEPIYIDSLFFRLEYPSYTKLISETKTERQLVAPAGTKVSIQGKASVPLDYARFEYGDTINLRCTDNEFSGTFVIKESRVAILHLKAYNELKQEIKIYAIPDLAPLVDIFLPGCDINLPYDMKIDIGILCRDDYGLEKGTFYYTLKHEDKKPLSLKRWAIEDTIFFTWDLSNLGMLPGDQISYFAEIIDNGNNKTRSKTYHIYFPTMDEIYQDVTEKEGLIHKEFDELQSEHKERMEETKRIHDKIMKERELSWAETEKLKEIIEKEDKILDKIESWQAELQKTIEKLNAGIVLDQQSIERLQEIAKILQELAPEELKKALAQLQLTLDKKPQEQDINKALENLKNAQEELARALERTLEIMKRFMQEEKLKELIERTKDLIQKQEEIEQLLKKGKTTDADSMQKANDQDLKDLIDELKEFAQAEGLEQEIKEALEKLAQKMQEMSAPGSQSDKKKSLEFMANELEMLYEKMTAGRAANLRKKLLGLLNQLIEISKAEEKFYKGEIEPNMELQNQIITATKIVAESLYTLERTSFYVSPQMSKNLARAIIQMEKINENPSQIKIAQRAAQTAMTMINIVCYEMLQRFKEIAEGGSSSGMDKFLQSLANISKGQMSLNQSLFSLFPIPLAGLTSEQMSQIQSLARSQQGLRQALESLQAEAGLNQQQDMLGNIIDQMKQTEEDLYQYKIDRQLIERQQMIISRLLDAQHSIRKEDYGEKRKSEPGKDIGDRGNPENLPEELGKDQLRMLLQDALREAYPKDYEIYIRNYFKTLLEEK